MPRNGLGVYTPPYNWEDDDANDIPIRSDRMEGQDTDMATALTQSLAYDGQTVPVANLPMGGFKHTGVAAATASDQYLTAGQAQTGSVSYFAASGTDTYTLTPIPAAASYAAGQSWKVTFTNGNTGAATINVSALGAKAITKRGALALVAGDIPAGATADITYDGTQFQLQNVAVEPDYFTASGTDTYTVTASPVLTAYAAGRSFKVLFTNGNTGAATINFSGLGAKDVTKAGSTALGAGDIAAGAVVALTYDGTRFQTGLPTSVSSLGLTAGSAQTGDFTAAINTKYVCNFTAAATITLPASASAGDIIFFSIGGGYPYLFNPNGLKVNGITSTIFIGSDMQSFFITYTGATNGWV